MSDQKKQQQVDLSKKISIKDIAEHIKDKRILIRVDFNVPVGSDGQVADDTRIRETVPTIKMILEHKPKYLVMVSHRGRPDGQPNKKYSMKPLVPAVSKHCGVDVQFIDAVVGEKVQNALKSAKDGALILLENVRFHIEEEGKGKDSSGKKVKADKSAIESFRKELSSYADIYANDAFGTAHRAHSSVVGINPSSGIKAAGLLLLKELQAFSKVLQLSGQSGNESQRPYVAVLGGAKVVDKIPVIDSLLERVNTLLIGGGMAFTFKKVLDDMKIGKSLYDEKGADTVKKLMEKAKSKDVKVVLPSDFVCGDKFPKGKPSDESAQVKTVVVKDEEGIPDSYMGLDIGPQSAIAFASELWNTKTIVSNGPMGVFEYPAFSLGTVSMLHAAAAATQLNGAFSVLGGGDSVAAANQFGVGPHLSHLSTGGGASLELLEGKSLPGIVALSDKDQAVKRVNSQSKL